MGRPPHVPVDLQAVTRDIKARVRRVIGELDAIEQQQGPLPGPENVLEHDNREFIPKKVVKARLGHSWDAGCLR
jgi:hypothetical protein